MMMMRHVSRRLQGTPHHHQKQQKSIAALPTNHHFLSRRGVRFPLLRCCCICMRDLGSSSHHAVLGLTPFASKSDIKLAYKRLALKYHPDVYKGEDSDGRDNIFREVKLAYESLLQKFEEEELPAVKDYDEYDDWDEWMGFEGGIPVVYNPL